MKLTCNLFLLDCWHFTHTGVYAHRYTHVLLAWNRFWNISSFVYLLKKCVHLVLSTSWKFGGACKTECRFSFDRRFVSKKSIYNYSIIHTFYFFWDSFGKLYFLGMFSFHLNFHDLIKFLQFCFVSLFCKRFIYLSVL